MTRWRVIAGLALGVLGCGGQEPGGAEAEAESEAESEGGGCGDGVCALDEACSGCPEDCCPPQPDGPAPACGDGKCEEAAGESCETCPDDCDCGTEGEAESEGYEAESEGYEGEAEGYEGEAESEGFCGDGYCDTWAIENCETCFDDCGSCDYSDGCSYSGDPTCGGCACEGSVCAEEPFCCEYWWGDFCVELCFDAGACVTTCGDGYCTGDETPCDCPGDCYGFCPTCGDGDCSFAYGEGCADCAADCGDCGTCGDGACNTSAGENCLWCADCDPCGTCGDGMCNPTDGEYCSSCAADCGGCVCPAGVTCTDAAGYSCLCCGGSPDCWGDACWVAEYIWELSGGNCAAVLAMSCEEIAGSEYCFYGYEGEAEAEGEPGP